MVRGGVVLAAYLGFLVAVLFFSFGGVRWPLGWASMGMYAVISIVSFCLADNELVRERSEMRAGTQVRDAVIAGASWLFFYPITLLTAGLDAGRFGWSPPIGLVVQLLALAVYGLANLLGLWAVLTNRYFSTFVRMQEDRGQTVETGGPYRYLRHPGYAGTILGAMTLPVALGSLWALVPAVIGASGFVVRTALEDRMLLQELEGYAEYAAQVRTRLLPGIW